MYMHDSIKLLNDWYEDIITNYRYKYVRDQLEDFCNRAHAAYLQKNEICMLEISNWHPEFIGVKKLSMLTRSLSIEDFQLTIARAYHYAQWQKVKTSKDLFDWTFEEAVDHIVYGRIGDLEALLDRYPYLVQARSSYAHRAGLIHYVSSNGVEMWRQIVPDNLVNITKSLLKHGADPHMASLIYGGGTKVINLIESSAHPHNAGISKELEALFHGT